MLDSINRHRPVVAEPEERTLEVLRFLILGSRGGANRGRILEALLRCPRNAFEISKTLDLNYGTVTAHLKTLVGAGLVVSLNGGRYAQGYAVTGVVRKNITLFERLRGERRANGGTGG